MSSWNGNRINLSLQHGGERGTIPPFRSRAFPVLAFQPPFSPPADGHFHSYPNKQYLRHRLRGKTYSAPVCPTSGMPSSSLQPDGILFLQSTKSCINSTKLAWRRQGLQTFKRIFLKEYLLQKTMHFMTSHMLFLCIFVALSAVNHCNDSYKPLE